jgi:hypothetical protein
MVQSDWVHVHEIAVMFGQPSSAVPGALPGAKLPGAGPGAVLAVRNTRRYKRGNFPKPDFPK